MYATAATVHHYFFFFLFFFFVRFEFVVKCDRANENWPAYNIKKTGKIEFQNNKNPHG